MANQTNAAIGLTVPGRSSTPCDGVPQHFHRLGDPLQQMTRTFPNGTTITFGTNDHIPNFSAGDPFYEQVQSIQAVEEEIQEIRRKFEEVGLPSQLVMSGGERNAELDRYGGLSRGNSSVQGYLTRPGRDPPSRQVEISKEAFKLDSRFLSESHSRHQSKPSRRSRRNRDYSHTFRDSEAKICNESGRIESSVQKSLVAKIPAETGRNSHQAPGATKSQVLHEAPTLQFNSFGASIPDASTTCELVSAAGNQTQSAMQVSSVRKNQTQKPAKQRRLEEISLHGCYLKSQHSSNATATRKATSQMPPASSGLMLQNPHNSSSQRQEPVSMQMIHSDVSFNAVATARTIPTIQQRTSMRFPVTGFRDQFFPNQDYYGPSFCMTDMQKAKIMSANGIKLPATYRPDERYYHGPLHFFVPPVAAVIVAYVDSATPQPPLPLLPCHSMNTMLAPYGVPPHAHIPGLSQAEMHIKECLRHYELMKEVLAVPGYMSHGEAPIVWYRILSSSHPRSQQPVWHPAVIDLYGKEDQYEHLLMRDVNFRNNNQKGVGRPGNRLYRSGVVTEEGFEQKSATRDGQEHQKTPVMTRDRAESETSLFFPDCRPRLDAGATYQYLGYALKSKRHEEPDPEISPTQRGRDRTTRSSGKKLLSQVPKNNSAPGGNALGTSSTDTPKKTPSYAEKPSTGDTPLLDFDKKYTEEHGEGEDVDFALRDLGPPKIQGKTFNQAIGFTPSPEKGTGASAPFGYPMNVWRGFRD